ncbi:MAG: NADH-quinone oxidoreductase subunit C [Verrucomicrobiota bacterium]
MTASEVVEAVKSKFGDSVRETVEFRGEHTVVVDPEVGKKVLKYCHDELAFDCLVDLSSLDHFGEDPRFEMVYELYSYSTKSHFRVRFPVSEDEGKVETVSDIWATADWHEREVYDMMGLLFDGHPDLRRILMWDGYPFYPLRKDFPLAGRESDLPDVAFTGQAPLAGGPFVTSPSSASTVKREPRSREID